MAGARAVFEALAHPEAQAPRERALAYLTWAFVLSLALHSAVLSLLGTMPFRFGGALNFALTVRVVPAPPETLSVEPGGEPRPAPAPERSEAREAVAAAQPGATLPHRHFTSREVDVPARVLEQPPLVYPEDPYLWKLPGKVRLRVFIDREGRVETVELVSAEPRGYFEQAAIEAARAVRYRPAELRGQPVRSQKLIEVAFDPHEHLPRSARER
jgi:TonB family protein